MYIHPPRIPPKKANGRSKTEKVNINRILLIQILAETENFDFLDQICLKRVFTV